MDNETGQLGKIFDDEDTYKPPIISLNSNNNTKIAHASVQQIQIPLTPQSNRIRNTFMPDMVSFSPTNGIMSQDNASGKRTKPIDYSICVITLFVIVFFSLLCSHEKLNTFHLIKLRVHMILVIIIVNKACHYTFSPRNVTYNPSAGRRGSTNGFVQRELIR